MTVLNTWPEDKNRSVTQPQDATRRHHATVVPSIAGVFVRAEVMDIFPLRFSSEIVPKVEDYFRKCCIFPALQPRTSLIIVSKTSFSGENIQREKIL